MEIIICGAGEVGRHAAEVLASADNDVTLIDVDASKLRAIEETLDVRTLVGNCASAELLLQSDVDGADMLIAATSYDEVNIVTASVAKGLGAKKTIARVHMNVYFEQRSMSYQAHFGIDRLICPEYSTALAIAQVLRNPGAVAIETFARGQIEMQQFPVSDRAEAIGRPLSEVPLPSGTRLAAIRRGEKVSIPSASSTVDRGDSIILVGNTAHFHAARKFFHDDKVGRRKVVIMGGPPMAVWLCRALRDRNVSIRLFEIDPERAEDLAELLDWVTVIQADPTDRAVFDEEHIGEADAFVALVHDEENILGCVAAKSMGVPQAIAVVEKPNYVHLLEKVGIDRPFSPRMVAVKEIERVLDESPMRLLTTLAEGVVDAYRVRVADDAQVAGKSLREVTFAPNWMVAAIQRGEDVRVPAADDEILPGDTVLMIGQHGCEQTLIDLFNAGPNG